MKYYRKQYVQAFKFTDETQLDNFKQVIKDDLVDIQDGKLTVITPRQTILVPKGNWLVYDEQWITFSDDVFNCIYHTDEVKLKQTKIQEPNPLYLNRPYPNNVRAIRQELGLSTVELGSLCNLGYTTIANIERGDVQVTDYHKMIIEQHTGYEVKRF